MTEVYRTELTPLSFLERSAMVYPTKTTIVHGEDRITYPEMARKARHTASALGASGIWEGDRVAYLCPNIPRMLVAHFAVPLLGAITPGSRRGRSRGRAAEDLHRQESRSMCSVRRNGPDWIVGSIEIGLHPVRQSAAGRRGSTWVSRTKAAVSS